MTLYALGDAEPMLPADGDCWIAPGAHVIGRVILASGTSIWFGSTLRGDNEPITIGEGTNVQEYCVLHTDIGFPLTIAAGCTIGHKAMLHGCEIAEGSLIGMGATVLNRARIGRNCLVGAGALVTEGKRIPEGSLVLGSPGKVVRSLDAEERQKLEASALHYRENMRRFRDGLRPL